MLHKNQWGSFSRVTPACLDFRNNRKFVLTCQSRMVELSFTIFDVISKGRQCLTNWKDIKQHQTYTSSMATHFKKYLCPEGVLAISQPGGSGTSSGISYEDWRRCWGGAFAGPMLLRLPGETAPSCREAGEECALTCWGVRVPAVPASVLACRGIED